MQCGRLVAFLWICVYVSAVTVSAEDLVRADPEAAKVIFRGMLAERQAIQSGVIEYSGSKVVKSPKSRVSGPIKGLIAFDKRSNLLRFDNEEPMYAMIINGDAAIGGRAAVQNQRGVFYKWKLCYLRNQEYSASWTREGPATRSHVEVRPPKQGMGGRVAQFHHMHDIRAVGIMDSLAFERGTEQSNAGQEIIESLLKRNVSSIERGDGHAVIKIKDADAETTLKVETVDGYRPVELKVENIARGWLSVSQTEWTRKNGCDVPVVASIRWEQLNGTNAEYKYEFNWKSVNEPVDPAYFDYHTFQNIPIDLGVQVIDSRGPEVQIVGPWDEGSTKPLPTEAEE